MPELDLKTRFPEGDLPAAYVTIIKRLPDRPASKKAKSYGNRWRYRIACMHCGGIEDAFHHTLVKRVQLERKRCRKCSHVIDNTPDDKPMSFDYHLWVDPPWPAASCVDRSDVR